MLNVVRDCWISLDCSRETERKRDRDTFRVLSPSSEKARKREPICRISYQDVFSMTTSILMWDGCIHYVMVRGEPTGEGLLRVIM